MALLLGLACVTVVAVEFHIPSKEKHCGRGWLGASVKVVGWTELHAYTLSPYQTPDFPVAPEMCKL